MERSCSVERGDNKRINKSKKNLSVRISEGKKGWVLVCREKQKRGSDFKWWVCVYKKR